MTLGCVIFCLLLKLPSLRFPHDEPDEVVYWSVSENLLGEGHYSLRGAPILPKLSARIYDRPLFHHPPLYPALLTPFVAADARQAAVIWSWLGHALCVVAIGLFLSRRLEQDIESIDYAWLPLLAMAVDPLATFVARKLWIDALMAGLVALSIGCAYRAGGTGRSRVWLVAGGVVLGLAGLAKVPALLAAPIAAATIVCEGPRLWSQRLRRLAWFAVPSLLLTAPWFIAFFANYGLLLPNWLKPDAFALQNYPFVARAVGLPWYYYGVKLLLGQPLLIVAAFALFAGYGTRSRNDRDLPWHWTPALWFAAFLTVSTLQGVGGYGFQMRYVVSLVPAIYAGMACWAPARTMQRRWWGRPLQVGLLTWSALNGALYLLTPRYDEFLTLFEAGGLINF